MKSNKLKLGRSRFVINPNLPDLCNDPVFKRKAESCKRMLIKAGWPEAPTHEKVKAFFEKLNK
jgi:hypothetical protein